MSDVKLLFHVMIDHYHKLFHSPYACGDFNLVAWWFRLKLYQIKITGNTTIKMALWPIHQTKCLPTALVVKLPNFMSTKCITPMVVDFNIK